MIETLTIITLCVLYLVYFRPGTTPQLQNPLVIERIGKYRMTLAPQLNLAQPFIEAVARHIGATEIAEVQDAACIFEVRDKRVAPKGCDHYVLAVTLKDGMLFFEAMTPAVESHGEAGVVGVSCNALHSLLQEVAAGQGINVRLRKGMGAT